MEEGKRISHAKSYIKRKQRIALISVIMALIVAIIIVIINIVNDKSKEVYASQKAEELQNKNNTLIVGIEENTVNEINEVLEENIIDENVIENEVSDGKTSNTKGPRYRLEVNCEKNVVNVYEKDENGEYSNCVRVMLCSIGYATPKSGTYSLKKYGGWEWKGLQGDVYGQYATQITGNILFHSVPYTEKYNNASLEYWEYDKLGTPASLGCIRLTVRNAKWIYDNCASGTKVMFYSDSNPGPLGKPSEQKISGEVAYRGWDPTDPSSANPWKNYGKEEVTPPPANNEEIPPMNNNEIGNNEVTPPINNEIKNNEENPTVNDEIVDNNEENTEKNPPEEDKTESSNNKNDLPINSEE